MSVKLRQKISIIIPVYNVENYLPDCLDSIVNQTLTELEIICIDDGSNDSSGTILDQYAAKDDRVTVIHNENYGYGHTMNMGLQLASGEYVGIVESDDEIELDMFAVLYQYAEEYNVDFVKSDYYECYICAENHDRTEYKQLYYDKSYYNRVLNPQEEMDLYKFAKYTWNGIYRLDYLRENQVLYNETPGASYQDNGFWFQSFVYAKSAYFLDQAFYHYRVDNPNSSVNSSSKAYAFFDEFDYIEKINEGLGERGIKYQGIISYYRLINSLEAVPRMSMELKLPLLRRIRNEFISLSESGKIETDLFSINMQLKLFHLISNPEEYCQRQIASNLRVTGITQEYDKIIIYGAGKVGRLVFQRIREEREHYKVVCFAVSGMEGNPEVIDYVPVREIAALSEEKEKALVIIAVTDKFYVEMEKKVIEMGFHYFIKAEELL